MTRVNQGMLGCRTSEGAVNFNMNILPKQGPVEWVTRISAEKLKGLVSGGGNAPQQQAGHEETDDRVRLGMPQMTLTRREHEMSSCRMARLGALVNAAPKTSRDRDG